MELAVHIRDPSQLEAFVSVSGHLTALYGDDTLGKELQGLPFPDAFGRIYVGDEFCLHRMVDLKDLDAFVGAAEARAWAVTLLTPPVTDEGLEKCVPLFERLDTPGTEAEVVVNDWGALEYVRERHPSLRVSLGRLLNKGFKDPRLQDAGAFSRMSEEAADLLNRCTFDFTGFQEEMIRRRVNRLERDLLPHGTPRWKTPDRLETSVYFPFGYVTMGRVCWLASFRGKATKKFSLGDTCPRSCRELSLQLSDPQRNLTLFQEGNAIFYRYPASLLASCLAWATRSGLRFVYQGLAIGVR
jgi:hypothetical protein